MRPPTSLLFRVAFAQEKEYLLQQDTLLTVFTEKVVFV